MKNVLVTGGSGGIGSAVAGLAAAQGWGVFIGYDSHKDRADAAAKSISSHSGRAWPLSFSLKSAETIDQGLDQIEVQGTPVKAVVLCASPAPLAVSFLKTTREELTDQLHINVLQNHYLLTQLWKRFFRKEGGGHVIAVLSAAIDLPVWSHLTGYVLGKRGLQALIECALAEFGTSGLRASFVSPGYTETPMLMTQNRLLVEAARAKTPDGTFLSPERVATVIVQALEKPPETASPRSLTVDPD